MNTILVATDGSPESAGAVAMAVDLAAEHRSELIVVHVVPTMDVAVNMGVDAAGVAFWHEPTEHDHAVLAEARAVATNRGIVVTSLLLHGSTVERIVAAADAHDVDLTIVGSHGHRTVASALMGSISLGVLRASHGPVMIVPGVEPAHAHRWTSRPAHLAGGHRPGLLVCPVARHERGDART